MQFSTLAPVRFGFGLAPGQTPPRDAASILSALRGPDAVARRWPGLATVDALTERAAYLQSRADEAKGEAGATAAFEAHDARGGRDRIQSLRVATARAVAAPDGMRDRLTAFWRGHFALSPKSPWDRGIAAAFLDDAIRAHVTGDFASMLRAAETHPAMMVYLDQVANIGPDSVFASRRPGKDVGLNENLAREMMELHTLGVGGPYTQTDVRQLAELLTGLWLDGANGTAFAPNRAEPGPETVLGHSYGGDPARMADIYAFLDALALHPATARRLSAKLATHFVGPDPSPALTDAMTQAYIDNRSQLLPVYQVLLTHPDALGGPFVKVRQPFDFVVAGLRAMGVTGADVAAMDDARIRRLIDGPTTAMGQRWLAPVQPNGWPEEAEAWLGPQQLAARVKWALDAPDLAQARLPDPMEFARQALGPRLTPAMSEAIPRAESRGEATALVLASAELNRR